MTRPVHDLLVVELLGGIGDLLLVLPALRALARAHPAARVRVLTFEAAAPLLAHDPAVDEVFCLPSRDEGLPLALLEAMAAGLPCVATGVGDVAAAVGDAAVVVPAGDHAALAGALSGLVRDRDRRRRLGAAARERVERCFDVRRTAARTAEVYEEATREAGDR